MGYTPFFMVYGAEAVLPSDIRHDSPRVAAYVEADNEKARQEALDLLNEECDIAATRTTKKRHIRDILGRTKMFSVIQMTLL